MSKSSTRILAVILAIVIFGGAFYLYQSGYFSEEKPEPDESAADAQPASFGGRGGPLPVEAVLIQAGSVSSIINVNGSTAPEDEVTMTSEVPGKITKIYFKEGNWIKAGSPMVQLDVAELKAQRERLLVQQQLTRKIAERLEGLYKKEGVSLQEYEIAKAEADQVDAELALIDVQIAKRTVKAPFDGLLGLKQVSEGSYLSPGTPIVNLVNTNPINIEFSVPEKYSQDIAKGTRIEFRMDGVNDTFTATVVAKEPNIDSETRTLTLKAQAPNPRGRILPGAFASVQVNLESYDDAILIPTQAIMPELDGKKVFVYRDGKAQKVPVETGIRKEDQIQVIEGLENGDTVITTGILQIRPGAPVTISSLN